MTFLDVVAADAESLVGGGRAGVRRCRREIARLLAGEVAGKLSLRGSAPGSWVFRQPVAVTAWHESGHALAAYVFGWPPGAILVSAAGRPVAGMSGRLASREVALARASDGICPSDREIAAVYAGALMRAGHANPVPRVERAVGRMLSQRRLEHALGQLSGIVLEELRRARARGETDAFLPEEQVSEILGRLLGRRPAFAASPGRDEAAAEKR